MSILSNSKFAPAIRRALIALACAAGLTALPALAQDPSTAPPPPPQGGWQGHRGGEEHQLEHLTKALNLTPDQVSQIKTIQTSTHQQLEALHADTATAPADKRAKAMSIHQAEQTGIKAVLTDEQKTKFDAMQARMREHREQRPDGEQGPPPPPPPAA